MSKISDLTVLRNNLIADAQVLVNSGLNSDEKKEQYRKILEQVDDHADTISMLARIERTLPSAAKLPAAPVAPFAASVAATSEQRRAELNATWRSHLQGQNTPETRDILTSSDAAGGAVVPQEFSSFLSEALKHYAPLVDFANTRFSPNGRSVKLSSVSDYTHGLQLITEGSASPVAEVDPSFSSSVLYTDLFTSGLIRFSNQLLSDSAFDLQQLLSQLSASRVGRGIEKLITLGKDVAGTSTPNNAGLVNLAQVAQTTATLSGGIGWGDLETVFDALDVAYLPKSVWLMSSKTRNNLAGLKDSTSRPFFIPGTQNSLDMLLGRPIVINQSLPLPTTANALPIIFGDLYNGLQIVTSEVRVQNLVERFAEVNESALLVSTRIGSAGLQAGALQALKLAAA